MSEEQPVVVTAEEQMKRMSRRSFLWAGVSVAGAYGVLRWINTSQMVDGLPKPLRKALEFNEGVWSGLYSPERLSPEFPKSAVTPIRVNGEYGVGEDFDPSTWALDAPGGPFDLDEIKGLPKTEMVTEHKCVEGWSAVVHWGGVRFSEFAKLSPVGADMNHVALATPDGEYYVSVDLPAMMHPQTLLCYEMNGKPLAIEHGGPLRLVIPHKYGVKCIKRIGKIRYFRDKAPDYWGEQGYDWYIGL